MKLWQKEDATAPLLDSVAEQFTAGSDRVTDMWLAASDVLGTIAHAIMLQQTGLLSAGELEQLRKELTAIYHTIEAGSFVIDEGVEDIHSQVEFLLTARLGDLGKKVHSGRSRNDQVLTDIRLFTRSSMLNIIRRIEKLFNIFQQKSELHRSVLLPGYTHLQMAMPSSFGLWFGAWAEALADDLVLLKAAFDLNNRNPLGSAAGFGTSFPLNRSLTTHLLGFDELNYNVVYAQMTRGKVERITATALAGVASTLSRFATDVCLFMNQNMNFLSLPEALTTGSSIMPHKKNPDVFELIRARSNRLQALPQTITLLMNNLPGGYFRDMQEIKEVYLPAFGQLAQLLDVTAYMTDRLIVHDRVSGNSHYDCLFTVESVNRMVLNGVPFRDAYRIVAKQLSDGTYRPERELAHSHEGSAGNLCNGAIRQRFEMLVDSFPFQREEEIRQTLLCSD